MSGQVRTPCTAAPAGDVALGAGIHLNNSMMMQFYKPQTKRAIQPQRVWVSAQLPAKNNPRARNVSGGIPKVFFQEKWKEWRRVGVSTPAECCPMRGEWRFKCIFPFQGLKKTKNTTLDQFVALLPALFFFIIITVSLHCTVVSFNALDVSLVPSP